MPWLAWWSSPQGLGHGPGRPPDHALGLALYLTLGGTERPALRGKVGGEGKALPLLLENPGNVFQGDAGEVRVFDGEGNFPPRPLLPKALDQSVNWDAVDLVYDDGTGSMRFLPTAVAGGLVPGGLHGADPKPGLDQGRDALRGGEEVLLTGDGCFRFPPRELDLEALRHGSVMVQVISGNATSLAPTPTLLSAVPDSRGLAVIGRNTAALLRIYGPRSAPTTSSPPCPPQAPSPNSGLLIPCDPSSLSSSSA